MITNLVKNLVPMSDRAKPLVAARPGHPYPRLISLNPDWFSPPESPDIPPGRESCSFGDSTFHRLRHQRSRGTPTPSCPAELTEELA